MDIDFYASIDHRRRDGIRDSVPIPSFNGGARLQSKQPTGLDDMFYVSQPGDICQRIVSEHDEICLSAGLQCADLTRSTESLRGRQCRRVEDIWVRHASFPHQ